MLEARHKISTLALHVVENDPKREKTNVPLNAEAREIVERVREDTGIPKVEALTRILEWFASLDRKLRIAVLSRDLETRQELTKLVIREMAGLPKEALAESAEQLTPEQTMDAMRAMLDQMETVHRSMVRSLEKELREKAEKAKKLGK